MASTNYVVTAPLVIAKNEDGSDRYVYQGGVVPDGQSEEWIKSHKDSNMIATPKAAEKELAEQPPGDDDSKK